MATTEDTMRIDRAPPERSEPAGESTSNADAIDAEREAAHDGLSSITTEPGARRTSSVEMLVIEAELVADGHEPDNPAQPRSPATAEAFAERIEETDLVAAWTRPWEGDDE